MGVEQEMPIRALRMGWKGAERSGWRGHIWRQQGEDVCGGGQLPVLSPNLSKQQQPRKYSPDPVKRPEKPALQMGEEAAPNLPAAAAEANEETNKDGLREGERTDVSPKGPQCSRNTAVNSNICRAVSERLQFFPRGHGVRFRAWCHRQVPSYLWGQTQSPRPRARS